MSARSRIASLIVFVLPALTIVWAASAHSAAASETRAVILVATPQFHDPIYGETILIASHIGGNRHMGFILNKPTKMTLADAFPSHHPSKAVRDPLYLGAPAQLSAVFALVASPSSPGRGSVQLSPDLFLVVAAETVDRVIATRAKQARFFAGAVIWQPGELDDEIKRGAWYVLDAEPDLVLPRKTEGMWRRLVYRAELRKKAI